jgi:hypothetical protein
MMMNWKGFGRKWSWPNFKVLSQHLPGGSEGKHGKPHSGYSVAGDSCVKISEVHASGDNWEMSCMEVT